VSELPVLSVQGVCKNFGALNVLQNVSLDLKANEMVAIIGHSGCGKTTLLRLICAFEFYDQGLILLDGARRDRPSKEALMLFQSFDQLQPWRTALGNVMYPLRVAGAAKNRARELACKRLADVGLSDFMNAYPHMLSGGMKQRVAMARALALTPRVLLMDEPFAALDNITRSTLQNLTSRVCGKYGISALLVTHSVEEALIMGDRIVVMDRNPGRVKAIVENPCRDISGRRGELKEKIMKLLQETAREKEEM
jgi:NitT/TauT family transport system ATP-binding protein